MDLAAQPSTTPVALKTIAERNDISLQFLEHIFASFRRTGIVKSVKGSQGGYNLAKAADEITVASVVEALEGSYHLEDEDVLAENSYKGISDTIQKLADRSPRTSGPPPYRDTASLRSTPATR